MSKPVTAIPLSIPVINGNEWKYVRECLDTGWVSSAGKYVDRFEQGICSYTGAQYAVACVNGTAGLHIALQLAGVGPGDEVIVPTLTFIAPVNAVRYLQAEPVFMDCDDFLNLDAVKLQEFCGRECTLTRQGLKNKKSKRIIKAIIPVHIFGNPCDLDRIMMIAKKYRLKVIEDATESLGSYFLTGRFQGKHTGTIGDIGIYSFNGNKIITSGGGGMIVTNSDSLAKKAKYLTTQAKDDERYYIHNEIGYNYRLSNIQAAMGMAQLERLDKIIKTKKDNYFLYNRLLRDIPGINLLNTPAGAEPNYWFYPLLVEAREYGRDRDGLIESLAGKHIESRPLWYLNHWQKAYQHCQNYYIEKAEYYWQRVVNIPCSANLTAKDILRVARTIAGARG